MEQIQYPEAASQTFKRGDLVYLVSGKVTVGANVGTLDSTGNVILGFAAADATGVTNTAIPVDIIDSQTRWVLPVAHATPGNAITAVTQSNQTFQLERTAIGKWSVPIDDATNPVVTVILSPHPKYAVGEQYGWVVVKFIATELQFGA
jgi:hypothetical protein